MADQFISARDIKGHVNLPRELSITIARIINNWHGFAHLLMSLAVIKSTTDIPTAGTDGATIWFNPEFFKTLSPEEREFLVIHEVMHIVYNHPVRAKWYKDVVLGPDGKLFCFKRWNIACDFIINKQLVDSDIGKMPVGGMFDPHCDWKIEGASEVYLRVPEQEDDDEGGSGSGDGDENMDVHVVPDETTTGASPQAKERAVAQAAHSAKQQGKGEGIFEVICGELFAPKKDWRELLRSTLIDFTGVDEMSFAKVNRRALVINKMILPDAVGAASNAVAVIIDTSGSVSDEEATAFMSELSGIMMDANPAGCKVFFTDDRVRSIETVEDYSEIAAMKWKRGGGTDMEAAYPAVFENMAEFETDYSIVILTDGYTNTRQDPNVPVIWVTTQSEDLSYGEVIKLDL